MHRQGIVVILIVVVVMLATVLAGEDWMIVCPFYLITGLECPFCGGQRMIASLLHGDWLAAFNYNPLLFCALPLLLLWIVRLAFPEYASRHSRVIPALLFTDGALLVYFILLLVWGVVRNCF